MENRFAVLIDVDNISYSNANSILDEIRQGGEIVICRAYGDWSSDRLATWKKQCLDLAIRPMMQIQDGKNSSDGLIFIDAMEIRSMQPCPVNAFCIVSTDSDFSSLSTRLREYGYFVVGIGNENAKKSYINTFHKFVFLSNLDMRQAERAEEAEVAVADSDDKQYSDPQRIVDEVYWSLSPERDWVYLSALGYKIRQKYPAFDQRTYGFPKLLDLVKAMDARFERRTDDCSPPGYLLRCRDAEPRGDAPKADDRLIGIVERVIANYGFIAYEGQTYYFHEVNLEGAAMDDLRPGMKVRFNVAKSPNPSGVTKAEQNGLAARVSLASNGQ